MKICLTGDVFLGGDLLHFNSKVIYSDIFNNADFRVVNLEQAVSENSYNVDKSTLYTSPLMIKLLKDWNVDVVNLANNHIHDKGLSGISETVAHLTEQDIPSFGAGSNYSEARRKFSIDEEIVILGYCDFNKPTLNDIAVASEQQPGVNPLRYESIIDDLSSLKDGEKAILYFHWGREHMWIPSYENIEISKKLLEHDKVLTIIGMHPHRIQGYIQHNDKRAYMCLGNFIFPNFFMLPPTYICNEPIYTKDYLVTRKYHRVSKLTYKKWAFVNRISMLIEFDTKNNSVKHNFVYQRDDIPEIYDVPFFYQKILNFFLIILSLLYKSPRSIYMILEKINIFVFSLYWKISIYIFWLKQDGLVNFLKKVYWKIKSL